VYSIYRVEILIYSLRKNLNNTYQFLPANPSFLTGY
jgi:hypothetical protein